MKRIPKIILLICVLYLTVCLIVSPHVCMNAGRAAAELCLDSVIPSLFPFFVCSGLFVALGLAGKAGKYLSVVMRPLFNVPGAGAAALILGIVSGYPTGAVCAASLYGAGECTKTEAERLCAFCNNSGPLFIMGVVACGILHTPQAGKLLYISHILSALLCGLCFRFYKYSERKNHISLPPSGGAGGAKGVSHLGEVIDTSVITMLRVCSYVILFSVTAAVIPGGKLRPYLHSILEITGGINALARTIREPMILLPAISFFIAFSGISVIFQVYSVISPVGLSIAPYIFGKLIQGGFSFIITYTLLLRFPETRAVFSYTAAAAASASAPSPWGTFFAALLSSAAGGIILLICAAAAKRLCIRKNGCRG